MEKPNVIEAEPDPRRNSPCRASGLPKGNIYMTMRDEFGPIHNDEQFVALFPERGQPTAAPWRLSLVTIMNFLEDLTDRQAADAVRGRIDWKYALSLPLSDAGFDYSILSKFRTRLVEGQAEQFLIGAGSLSRLLLNGQFVLKGFSNKMLGQLLSDKLALYPSVSTTFS